MPLAASQSSADAAAQDRATRSTSAAPEPGQPEPSPIDVAARQAAAAEQAFHDGLQALLVGQARAATGPLDRACGLPSTSQDDICYWAAVAWLRAGDRSRARQALSDVLARWPRSTHAGEASVALGWLLLDAGDRAAARNRFAAAVDDRMPGVRAEATRGLAAAH
jgi:TolA-binding protein